MTARRRVNRGLELDQGWIKRRFTDLDRQLRELRAAKSGEAMTVGTGGITVKNGGDIRYVDENGNTTFTASQPIQVAANTNLIDVINFNNDGDWHQYALTNLDIPAGFNRALVEVIATVQCTGDGTGTGIRVYAAIGGTYEGDRVSQGTGDGSPRRMSCTSSVKVVASLGGADTLTVSAWVLQSGVAVVDTGQLQVCASAVFLR